MYFMCFFSVCADEIAFLEGMTVVYKSSIDLFFYVVGSAQENEVRPVCRWAGLWLAEVLSILQSCHLICMWRQFILTIMESWSVLDTIWYLCHFVCQRGWTYNKKSAVSPRFLFYLSLSFPVFVWSQLMLMAVLNCLFESLSQMLRWVHALYSYRSKVWVQWDFFLKKWIHLFCKDALNWSRVEVKTITDFCSFQFLCKCSLSSSNNS